MCGTQAAAVFHTPMTSTSHRVRTCSGGVSHTGRPPQMTAAAATAASSRPNSSTAAAAAARSASASRTSATRVTTWPGYRAPSASNSARLASG